MSPLKRKAGWHIQLVRYKIEKNMECFNTKIKMNYSCTKIRL